MVTPKDYLPRAAALGLSALLCVALYAIVGFMSPEMGNYALTGALVLCAGAFLFCLFQNTSAHLEFGITIVVTAFVLLFLTQFQGTTLRLYALGACVLIAGILGLVYLVLPRKS